jgi:hypothetical protein
LEDFGEAGWEDPDGDAPPRADVMARLLQRYASDCPAGRTTVRVNGAKISESIRDSILAALRAWAAQHATANAVRTSIDAQCYMILRKEASGKYQGSAEYAQIWALAEAAIEEVDPAFAAKFTALAVTGGECRRTSTTHRLNILDKQEHSNGSLTALQRLSNGSPTALPQASAAARTSTSRTSAPSTASQWGRSQTARGVCAWSAARRWWRG